MHFRQAVTSGGSWFGWRSLGGAIIGTPTASCVGKGLRPAIVWARGTNNELYRRVVSAGARWQSLGGQLTSSPSAVPAVMGACPNVEDVFMLGAGGAIYEWTSGTFRRVGGTSNAAPGGCPGSLEVEVAVPHLSPAVW